MKRRIKVKLYATPNGWALHPDHRRLEQMVLCINKASIHIYTPSWGQVNAADRLGRIATCWLELSYRPLKNGIRVLLERSPNAWYVYTPTYSFLYKGGYALLNAYFPEPMPRHYAFVRITPAPSIKRDSLGQYKHIPA